MFIYLEVAGGAAGVGLLLLLFGGGGGGGRRITVANGRLSSFEKGPEAKLQRQVPKRQRSEYHNSRSHRIRIHFHPPLHSLFLLSSRPHQSTLPKATAFSSLLLLQQMYKKQETRKGIVCGGAQKAIRFYLLAK